MKFLIVCKGNTCRSPMLKALLEDFLRKFAGKIRHDMGLLRRISTTTFDSAGTYQDCDPQVVRGKPANEHSIACMDEHGIDLRGHRSKAIADININDYDLIVCMTLVEAKFVMELQPRGAVLLANAVNGGVPNPYEKGLQAYQECSKALVKVADEILATYF